MREELIACFQDTYKKSNEGILKLKTERAIQSNHAFEERYVGKQFSILGASI